MTFPTLRSLFVFSAISACTGCVHNVEAGLANAPSAQHQSQPRHEHDAISNGPDAVAAVPPPGTR